MKNLYPLIKKNLKLLFRSKSSALVFILAPLVIIVLLGLSYTSSQTNLNLGVYSPSFTEEINSFLSSLEEEYHLKKYENKENCLEEIKIGLTHACLLLPSDFQIKDNTPKEVVFYVDQTKMNLVYLVLDVLNKKFNLKSKEISQTLTSELLNQISQTKTQIEKEIKQIEETKTKNQQALSQSKTIKKELSSLDFVLPSSDHNLTSRLTSFKNNFAAPLSEGLSFLQNLKSAISSTNLSNSEKENLKTILNKVTNKFNQLSSLINGSDPGTLGEISTLVSSLENDFSSVKNKLQTASKKISSTNNQLSSLSNSLEEGLSSLEGVQTVLSKIQEELTSQKITDPQIISAPLITKIEKVTVEKTPLDYLFPSLIILALMFVSLLLGTTLVMMEKHNLAYFRNFIVPVRKVTFVFSTYLTTLFLLTIQIMILLGLSLIFLKDILTQLPLTALLLLASSSVFILIGMFIGYLFTSEDTGALASISLGSLFLFLSGIILPLENMPSSLKEILAFNPFVISEQLLRKTFIFKASFPSVLEDFLLLIAYTFFLFLVILIFDNLASKHFLTKTRYKHHKHLREKRRTLKPS